jgi:hypothetical protein
VRLRSFRNVVVLTTVLMAVLAFVVALMGFLRPTWLPLSRQRSPAKRWWCARRDSPNPSPLRRPASRSRVTLRSASRACRAEAPHRRDDSISRLVAHAWSIRSRP